MQFFFSFSFILLISNLVFSQFIFASPCEDVFTKIESGLTAAEISKLCLESKQTPACVSQVKKTPIFHFEKIGHDKFPKKILVFSMVHGDEHPAGRLAMSWMLRALGINGRNTWRILPLVNPDGLDAKTRNNGRGVDINRNLPTKNWEIEANQRWKVVEKENPRRFPGAAANSESETQCILSQIEEFNPDFIISLHTPYGLLDFDGPEKINFALKSYTDMPWKRLGHYPGSLGRYMWAERSVPVLTIEMKGNKDYMSKLEREKLQDSLGTFAIQLLTQFDRKSMISSAK